MFIKDPYSERTEHPKFLSKNVVFIGAALILTAVAVAELVLVFRMHRQSSPPPLMVDAGHTAGDAGDAVPGFSPGVEDPSSPIAPDTDWRLMLVNEDNPLPHDFTLRLATIRNTIQIDERVREPLNRMLGAAGAEGLTIVVASAYRSIERQQELYDDKVRRLMAQGRREEQARAEAVREVAYPGTSEHHLGLAVDLVAYHDQRLHDGQADTAENRWLQENSHTYGFILRYPPDKSDITGIIYEPWHFRYVGIDAAGEITAQGLCLEEYLQIER